MKNFQGQTLQLTCPDSKREKSFITSTPESKRKTDGNIVNETSLTLSTLRPTFCNDVIVFRGMMADWCSAKKKFS